MDTTFRAVGFSKYGSVEVLHPLEVAAAPLRPQAVRIHVVAAGVNPADVALRSGQFRLFIRLKLPFVPGYDVAGIVTEVGVQVDSCKPGDAVYAMLPMGTAGGYGESVVVDQALVAPMPHGLTFTQAAGVPLAALTALQALRDRARLQPGQQVLIYGASGGVGTFAVQIARAFGARITAACSTRNLSLVQELGAQTVIDYTRQPLDGWREQFDAVFDAASRLPWRQALRLVKPGGTLVLLNPGAGNPITRLAARLRGRRLEALLVQPGRDDLAQLTTLIERGEVKPVIGQTYALSQAIEAHRHSETGRARGKIVLRIDEQLAGTTPLHNREPVS